MDGVPRLVDDDVPVLRVVDSAAAEHDLAGGRGVPGVVESGAVHHDLDRLAEESREAEFGRPVKGPVAVVVGHRLFEPWVGGDEVVDVARFDRLLAEIRTDPHPFSPQPSAVLETIDGDPDAVALDRVSIAESEVSARHHRIRVEDVRLTARPST
ncbi:MAG: hypothetical protein R3E97_17425 [Candidatus Eisenbacteria bacterium]